MSNFGDFGFGSGADNSRKGGYQNSKSLITEVTQALEKCLEPYKESLKKEFNSLEKNNEAWKKNHNGEDNSAFKEKQWAIAAPFNAIEIFTRLYINRKEN